MLLGLNYCNGLLNIENCNSDRQIAITKPIIECNSKCRCGMNCPNRLVGKSDNIGVKIEIFETDNKGKGLKALETIKKGSYICKYEGAYISRDEANKRWEIYDKEGLNYILLYREVKYIHIYQLLIFKNSLKNEINEVIIDATESIDSFGRYLNHSCDPNLEVHAVRVETIIPIIAFFANRDIEINEELTFDYSPDCIYYIIYTKLVKCDKNDMKILHKCFCGSSKCRGYLPDISCV